MQAGKLSERVTLLQPTEVRGGSYGDVQKTWAAAATVWAAVEPLNGRELLAAQQVGSEMSVRVRVRHRTDVTAKWRVQHGARVLEIVAPPIDVGGQGVETQLLCAEVRSG